MSTMLDIPPAETSSLEARQTLLQRMSKFRRQVRTRLVLEGAAKTIASAAVLGFATFVIDREFRLSIGSRWTMLFLAVVSLAYVIWRDLWQAMILRLDPLTLAAALDRKAGDTHEEFTACVASVMELPELIQTNSAAMTYQAVAQRHRELSTYDFRAKLDDRRRNGAIALIAAAIVIPIALMAIWPATARLWAARFFAGSDEPWPQRTYLQVDGVTNGMLVVPSGEPFALRVSAKQGSEVPEVVTIRYRDASGSRVRANMTAFAPNDFRYDLSGVNTATAVEIWGGDDVLPVFTIRPADRRRIGDLKLVTQHPWQKGPETYTFSGEDADLSFLPQTKMRLTFSATAPIAKAELVSSTTQPSITDLQTLDDEHFAIQWTHNSAAQLQILLVGKDAGLESLPTDISIGLKVDEPPRITLSYSGVHSRVTPMASIPLSIDARDDYGVARVQMTTKIERPDPNNPSKMIADQTSDDLFGPVNPATDLEVQQARTAHLAGMKLTSGWLVTFSGSATDACYTGPQTTRSRPLTFRVVQPEELFREILLRQQAERARFRQQTAEVRSIRQSMETLSSQDQVSQLAHRHRAVQREVTTVTTSLNDTVTEMRLNALATPEAFAPIQKNVLTPLKELNEQYLNPQKDALDALRFEDSSALAAVEDRQDKMASAMDDILKQMSQWDSFVDVLNQLNEIIRMQDQAEQNTKELKNKQTEGVFEP